MDHSKRSSQVGFTIVELLVVIVIISILAVISIVAYNGIQERARSAAITSALAQAQKKLTVAMNDGSLSTYPSDQAAFDALAISGGAGTTFQYRATPNSTTPNGYCITATNGTTSYKISETGSSSSGACAGHGNGGQQAITNLVVNPSVELGTANWGNFVAGGTVTTSRQTSGGLSGPSFYRMAWTANSTSLSGGLYPFRMGSGLLTVGNTYTASVYVRSSKNQTVRMQLTYRDSSGNSVGTTANGSSVSLSANTWNRLSLSAGAPANAYDVIATVYAFTGGTIWQTGDTFDGDAAMLTEGTSIYNYADGNSSDWIWNGAQNNSTSSGPAL